MIRDIECECETVNKLTGVYKATMKGYENLVLNGFRFHLDRTRDGTSYWKCCLHKTHTCKTRTTTVDKQLTSSVPEHTHDVQQKSSGETEPEDLPSNTALTNLVSVISLKLKKVKKLE